MCAYDTCKCHDGWYTPDVRSFSIADDWHGACTSSARTHTRAACGLRGQPMAAWLHPVALLLLLLLLPACLPACRPAHTLPHARANACTRVPPGHAPFNTEYAHPGRVGSHPPAGGPCTGGDSICPCWVNASTVGSIAMSGSRAAAVPLSPQPNACGHGTCEDNICRCDSGWMTADGTSWSVLGEWRGPCDTPSGGACTQVPRGQCMRHMRLPALGHRPSAPNSTTSQCCPGWALPHQALRVHSVSQSRHCRHRRPARPPSHRHPHRRLCRRRQVSSRAVMGMPVGLISG
jgi:hypothetical protein